MFLEVGKKPPDFSFMVQGNKIDLGSLDLQDRMITVPLLPNRLDFVICFYKALKLFSCGLEAAGWSCSP